MSRPAFHPPSLIYVSNCASVIRGTMSTAFTSTTTISATKRSNRYPHSSLSPLYSRDRAFCRSKGICLKVSSLDRHSSYTDSSKPGPSVRCTSMAAPMIARVTSLIPIAGGNRELMTLHDFLRHDGFAKPHTEASHGAFSDAASEPHHRRVIRF